MLVRSWGRSYRRESATISNCSNNYGPLPACGEVHPAPDHECADRPKGPSCTGAATNVRDGIDVDDHNSAVWRILDKGRLDAHT